eukprot:13842110-Heterocapsa_arctica.AAC.1
MSLRLAISPAFLISFAAFSLMSDSSSSSLFCCFFATFVSVPFSSVSPVPSPVNGVITFLLMSSFCRSRTKVL